MMNPLQITPLGISIALSSPGSAGGGSATARDAAQAQVATHAAPPVKPIEKKVAPPPPEPIQDKPRFNRNVGFFPNSLKVFIDLVDPNNTNLSYRIYGPRTPAPALKPIEVKGPSDASAAYSRPASPNGKDVAVA
jgi:hypothetical protein